MMDKEIIKDWLSDIATPTGISYSGDQTISESMAENIVDYVDELEQQCKKLQEELEYTIGIVEHNRIISEKNKEIYQLNDKINKAIDFYETYKQECVIGRTKDEKLIKDYYLPAQLSKDLIKILKGEYNVK